MDYLSNMNLGLGSLPLLSSAKTRSISAENPTGAPGGGAQAEPGPDDWSSELGKGWKVRPCIKIEAGASHTLAEIEGPGVIQHIWMTTDECNLRGCILRFYWDGEEMPSVEVPLGDFFALGHGLTYNVNSMPIAVNPTRAMNCYWPMPFHKSCRITIENDLAEEVRLFFYQIDYSLTDVPQTAGYFHAQWRRAVTDRANPDYIIVEGIRGQGHYAGTFLAWAQLADGWWGEGEIKFFIDGDREYPTICGTGTEDYFGGAWCFKDTYSTPFLGYPLWQKEEEKVPKHAMYRWHILDPVRFEKELRVTIQALGWWPPMNQRKFQPLADDIASVAYWYQAEPHAPFPDFPKMEQRWPR